MAPTVILIGFMGSGKSAVGRRLARRLGWQFIDTDSLVEDRAGRTIAQLFDSDGEDAFRKLEQEAVIKSIGGQDSGVGRVVSLGGGAVTSRTVASRLEKEPLVFFLDIDLETAYRRACGGARPLARDRAVFNRLFSEREKSYMRLARFIVDTRGKSADQLAGEINSLLSRQQRTGSA